MTGQIICVAQQKGGAGKTTLVSNLAIAFLAEGKRVALLDTDPQGSLGKWLDIREETLGVNANLRFSTATAYGISRAIREVGGEADVILVDTPPKADSDVRWVMRESNIVLVPVSASQADVWATHDLLELADRAGKPTHIVMNRTRVGTRVGEQVAKSVAELEAKQLQSSLANRVIYAEALGSGLGVIEAKKTGSASDEVRALAKEVSAILDL
ncbi:ParA family partition ATPase [Roseobacter sp. GAI101]|uniref:ParA family partition ATPase n=1 Tax=Roseobacter sp. (strain GAI101) TaxID=391589 RepID=UPI0001871553|nr:ParA family partition ATPase [Roseobacter sp. GAI101]EEB85288.1 ParA family protein [Roseobacter sp. GAI101]